MLAEPHFLSAHGTSVAGLESACRALDLSNVAVAVLQETKITTDAYTKFSSGYRVQASKATSVHQGGVALCFRDDHPDFELEEQRFFGPNVVTFRLITGRAKYYCLGAYIPPSDDTQMTLDDVRAAHAARPKGFEFILLGDLNIKLDAPRNTREEIIAEQCDAWGLACMTRSFACARNRGMYGRWTWRHHRMGRWVSSKPDYFLASPRVRKRLRVARPREFPHHDTDHRAIVAKIWVRGERRRLETYRRNAKRNPLLRELPRPLRQSEQLFEELRSTVARRERRSHPQMSWISDRTWALVDNRARLRRNGSLTGRVSRQLGRRIGSSLQQDRKERARRAGAAIEAALADSDLQLGWDKAKRCETLFEGPPPGDPIPIDVSRFDVRDDEPDDEEIREVVRARLKNGRASGASQLCAEDVKGWLRGMEDEEDPEKRAEGAGDQDPAADALDDRGIGLLEPFWKVVEGIMDTRLGVIEFRPSLLHGFVKGRGCGTAGIEAKLAQQFAYLQQSPLYGIFIDLRKAYDAMDRDRCMAIMEGYGVGPNMLRLIRTFWDEQKLVCRAAKRYGKPFKASRGVTQGGPLSPKIFNIMVDAIVREWIRQLFYRGGREEETEISDRSMDILTDLFDRVGLRTNTEKTKVMTCVNEKVHVRRSEEVYRNTTAGFHTEKDWRNRRVTCDHCGLEMSAKSLPGHLESQHGIYRSRVIDRDLVLDDRESITYAVMQSPSGAWDCPVPDCPGSVQTPWNLRRHFRDRHPLDLVNVPGEGVLPRCPRCDMQTNFANSRNHEQSKLCREGAERKAQYAAAAANARALEVEFTAYGETLERVEVFKYLGRLMAMDDNDMHAVRHNLKKARGVWKRFSVLLHRENLPPRVCGMFYKAVIQSVLLYGSETWSLSDSSMRRLEGFHFLAACRMARVNRPRRVQRDGTCQWSYPSKDDVYEEVGLFPIRHYIEVRRQTVAAYIVNQPIFDRCVDAERPRGSIAADDLMTFHGGDGAVGGVNEQGVGVDNLSFQTMGSLE
ncbi:hypothetical protein THAOC_19061 [Thalassiosira oceanica]|uniref:Reverse transcriptase domain-containing protein n=1 Tax=Thalassiosira oceanica TaxID=159749 RepID=K0SHS4_THAOC|nr:hypothetical protein THAOC_19061 [Thalassiosira oceanica]|eukprot:EJK60561.1 hypothetical protein THAOC_19061 [Thalassiosira oceanica]